MHAHDLYVLRHGQTEWNAAGRWQGRANSPLTALGLEQAARQRRILAGLDLSGAEAFSSPQGRAVETAGIALAPLVGEVRTDPRLREIDVGDWTGRLRAELHPAGAAAEEFDADDIALYGGAPGGEGLDALKDPVRGVPSGPARAGGRRGAWDHEPDAAHFGARTRGGLAGRDAGRAGRRAPPLERSAAAARVTAWTGAAAGRRPPRGGD